MKKAITWSTLIALCIPLATVGTAHAATDSEVVGVNDDGSKNYINYPVDANTQKIINQKMELVQKYKEYKAGKRTKQEVDTAIAIFEKQNGIHAKHSATSATKSDDPATLQQSASLDVQPEVARYSSMYITALIQEAQVNGYYCGPATAAMIVKSKGISATQSQTAAYLGTESTKDTAWYNGTYPMRDTLNAYISGSWYTPYGTTVTATQFKDNVTFDIDNGYGVAGDAYQVANGPHLTGHPINQTIYHWFAIDGYATYGDSTHYADPASGCTALSWGSSVPRYSTLDTTKVAAIVNGRGIIW